MTKNTVKPAAKELTIDELEKISGGVVGDPGQTYEVVGDPGQTYIDGKTKYIDADKDGKLG